LSEQQRIEFGTDGIRGIAGQYPLDPPTVLRIGRAIGEWLRAKTGDTGRVLIGRDTRISGHMLLHTLAGGLLAEGIDVENADVLSTPGMAYLTQAYGFDLGIVISASHNPFNQNGIKLFGSDGFKLDDVDEEAIEQLIEILETRESVPAFLGYYSSVYSDHSRYITHLIKCCEDESLDNLSVVLDCANGAAYKIAPEVFRLAGVASLRVLNADPDGLNINVAAGSEHVRRDRTPLLEAIWANKADVGIAFDGDADRVVFVTPEGMLVDGDHIMGILALELKMQGKLSGDTIVATDMSNSGLEHYLKNCGIGMSRTNVGDRYVMERLREKGFVLGGEQAGHVIILDDDLTTGDGIYVGMLVASLIARNKRNQAQTLHELASLIPRYPQVIASAHLNARTDLAKVNGLQALTDETLASFDHKGRVNIRFSGTEPNLLRAMVEGGPETSMTQVVDRSIALCTLVAEAAGSPNPRIDLVDCATGAPVVR